MKFKKWVEAQGGTTSLAAKLGIHAMAVHQWLNGNATPKALTMQKIVRMSKGEISYDDIINGTKKQKGV